MENLAQWADSCIDISSTIKELARKTKEKCCLTKKKKLRKEAITHLSKILIEKHTAEESFDISTLSVINSTNSRTEN